MPNLESCVICNQYGADGSKDPGWKPSELLPEYPNGESAMEDPIFYRLAFQIMGINRILRAVKVMLVSINIDRARRLFYTGFAAIEYVKE